jgi:hypothetical protein
MPTTTIASSQGAQFTFNAVNYAATNVKVKKSVSLIDVSTLDLTAGSMKKMEVAPLKEGDVISLSFLGLTVPPSDAAYAIAFTTLGVSGNAIAGDIEVEAAVGEKIKGTCTFTMTTVSA